MCNQLLFGEAVKILKKQNATWLKVESLYDGYIGWVTHHLITIVDGVTALQPCQTLAPHFLNKVVYNNQSMHVPLGSSLRNFKNKKGDIAGIAYSFTGRPVDTTLVDNKVETLLQQAFLWLNAPYMWGGKTILGVDCSGFCQTVYKLVGARIARDAWQQATQGKLVRSLKTAKPGDLAFFDEKDKIVHVGILLGPNEIIHASGKVRIDKIDRSGIINTDTGERTHTLKLIRRFNY
ncbi:C40 family peptidase [Niabella ginsengisoli]|uniref:C40 family peptidase n=1 Tax=Niabella ginsengisoli TaxID=522298 RepID=A0ABS9SQP6_9BACT|nr:C40 family peptidase [Niabella ginsengisoli]MCH5600700.1 C40 family peptidase [Niabella ginsengisoli]